MGYGPVPGPPPFLSQNLVLFFCKVCLVDCPALKRPLAEARLADKGGNLLAQPGPHSAKPTQRE